MLNAEPTCFFCLMHSPAPFTQCTYSKSKLTCIILSYLKQSIVAVAVFSVS